MIKFNSLTKTLVVKILQWFYLALALISLLFPLIFRQTIFVSLDLPIWFMWGITAVAVFYFLLLFTAFFTQNSILVIISLVCVFLTMIVGIILFGIGFINIQGVLSGVPACWNNLAVCSGKDAIIVASAACLGLAIPLVILNIVTIIGAIKALSAE